MRSQKCLATFVVSGFALAVAPAALADGKQEPQEQQEVPRIVSDFDGSGSVTGRDIYAFANAYVLGSAAADINGNGTVEQSDFVEFANAWVTGR